MGDDEDRWEEAAAGAGALDERKAAILKAVVTEYVEKSLPVGSAQIARDPSVEVSPATVRSDMAALERDGYLTHPHTSAGRVPTDKGYRFFVDHLTPLPLGPAKQEQVQEFFSRAHGELERMLSDTSRLLAQLTDTAAIVVPPAHERLAVRSAILTRLAPDLGLVVLVLSNGTIERHSVTLAEETPDEELRAASNFLDESLAGHSVAELARAGVSFAASGRPIVDALVARAVESIRGERPEEFSDQVFVGGASRIIEHFEAVEKVRSILSILEQSFVVVTLVNGMLGKGQAVSIGSEHGVEPLSECSLVVAPFGTEEDGGGTIGILGPTRMDYPQALAAVAVVGQRLSRELGQG